MTEIIVFCLGVLFGSILLFFYQIITKKQSEEKIKNIQIQLENTFNQVSQLALKNANDYLITTATEKLNSEKKEVRTDLDHKKEILTNLVEEVRKELKLGDERLKKSDDERLSSFSALKEELESYKKITSDLKVSTDDLKELLSNNQLRGQFGEQIAENLLKMVGFVIGQDYLYNKELASSRDRPDFTIFMPDRTKVNIDVKFPYSALKRYIETKDNIEQAKHLKQFTSDVKEKIKQVTTRNYINPEEKTMDFVILFIPNEMIFSFIYEKMNDVWEDAIRQKVILTGPFSFTAILRMIKQTYTNFSYQENLHQIVSLIQQFSKEFEKYNESFDKLGKSILKASEEFEYVSSTRTRQLTRIVDKIESAKVSDTSITEKLEI